MKNSMSKLMMLLFVFGLKNAYSQDEFQARGNFRKGMDFLELGKYEDAELAFRSAISFDSLGECGTGIMGDAYSKLGYALYMRRPSSISNHSYDYEAIPFLRRAIQLNPENPEPITNLGVVFIVLHEKDSAECYIDKAIAVSPTYAPAYYQKNRIIDDDEFPEEALKYINLFFQHFNSDRRRDELMSSSAKLTHLQLQKKLGLLTLKKFQDTIQTYYLNQSDNIVDYTIQVLNYPTTSADNFITGFQGFYGALFTNNPTIKEQFELRKDEFIQLEYRELFDHLMQNDFSEIPSTLGSSPELNDFYWGAFFATGDTQYLDELLEHCQFVREKESLDVFLMGSTAIWSLCSNSQRDELVKSYLQSKKSRYARKILKKSPKYFYTDTRRVLRKRFTDQLEK